jgi:chloramphenicol 3-O phosphotransferase
MLLVNGCSGTVVIVESAGNGAVAESLQARASAPWFRCGQQLFDEVMAPPRGADVRALHAAASGLARRGCNVVMDYAPADRGELTRFLDGLDVVWASDHSLDASSPDAAADAILEYLLTRANPGQPWARVAPPQLPWKAPQPGTAVLLCGTSSAGKSTLCRAIQDASDVPFVQLGCDSQIVTGAKRFMGVPLHPEDLVHPTFAPEARLGFFELEPGTPQNPSSLPRVQVGPVGRASYGGLCAAIASIVTAGINVVSDQVLLYPDFYGQLKRELEGLPALWVDVFCDTSQMWAHEKARGDREPGLAAGALAQIFQDVPFDLRVDSTTATPAEEASRVLEAIKR